MTPDQQVQHERIHIFYRQKLSEAEWELANALGRESAKDKIIDELKALLETDTAPEGTA